MKVFNICAKRKYIKDGKLEIKYYKVGTLKVREDGQRFLLLFQQPQVQYCVFEQGEEPLPIIY